MAKEKVVSIKKGATITTTVESFVAALKSSISDKDTPIPILSNVRITDNKVIGTDLDAFTIVPFESTGTIDCTIPHAKAIKVLTGEKGPLSIEAVPPKTDSHFVKLKFSGCEFELPAFNLKNFPDTPPVSAGAVTFPGKVFADAINKVIFAISKEESRYTLNGAKLIVSGGVAKLIATDGHRLSVVTMEANGKLDVLIPLSTLKWLKEQMGETVEIGEGTTTNKATTSIRGTVTCKTGAKTIVSHILNGTFPRWEAIVEMGEKHTHSATIANAKEMDKLIKRVAKVADSRSLCVQFSFTPSSLTLSAMSTDFGSGAATLDCKATIEDQFKVGLNAEFVTDLLARIGENELRITMQTNQEMIHFTHGNLEHYIMPMRI